MMQAAQELMQRLAQAREREGGGDLLARLRAAKGDMPRHDCSHLDDPGFWQRIGAAPTIDGDDDLDAEVEATKPTPQRRKPLAIPPNVEASTPLRLEIAARLAFPDGSLSVAALRRLAADGLLTIIAVRGKHFTTLADIEEMKTKCRVQAKDPGSSYRRPKTDNGSGSSATASARSALDALRATAKVLRESLPPTSPQSTTQEQAEAVVIPMRSK
jgi:hypothetical protein